MHVIDTVNVCSNIPSTTLKGDEMTKQIRRIWIAITAGLVMTLTGLLAGCGGGGSGAVSSEVVSGTAAVGAPLSGQVSLKDSSAPQQQRTAIIGSDGSYAIDVTGMKAPFVLQARGSAEGTEYRLHSFSERSGTANINPLSNIIVASAAGDDNPSDVFEKSGAEKCNRIKQNISQTVAAVLNKLQPLLKQYNAEHTNPITARYIANHLDLDGMFDNVKITVSNGNISIINKQSQAVIFTGTIDNIANGIFNNSALPPTASVPAAPSGLTAAGGTGQITLSWTSVSNATSYNLYFATAAGVTTGTGTRISPVTTPYIHTGLAPATTYYYVVTAVNSAGESAASAPVSAGTASAQPLPSVPAAPGGVIASGGTNQVTLSWNTVSSATSYNVYYATTSGVTTATGTRIPNATSPAVLTGLAEGTTYYYIVTAVNSTGESAASVQVAATTLTTTPTPAAPAAPSGVSAAGGTNQATITWPAVTGASSYNVYWSTATGVTKTTGTKVAGVTSPYIKTALTAGTTYYFVVTAVNSIGESAASAQVAATTAAAPPAVPAAPAGVTASGGTNQVSITWPAVSGATSYNIYWSTSTGVTTAGTKISAVTSPYAQTGLAAGTTYYFIVTAVNSAGESAASAQISATTTAPPAPACGSCHAIPPALNAHVRHNSSGIGCVTCHGTGYSSTTVNAATHLNGAKNVSISIWNATTRSCATQCHGARPW